MMKNCTTSTGSHTNCSRNGAANLNSSSLSVKSTRTWGGCPSQVQSRSDSWHQLENWFYNQSQVWQCCQGQLPPACVDEEIIWQSCRLGLQQRPWQLPISWSSVRQHQEQARCFGIDALCLVVEGWRLIPTFRCFDYFNKWQLSLIIKFNTSNDWSFNNSKRPSIETGYRLRRWN